MTRREFIATTSSAGLGLWAAGSASSLGRSVGGGETKRNSLGLLPYPHVLSHSSGSLQLGAPQLVSDGAESPQKSLALDCLRRHFPTSGKSVKVRLGSVEKGYDPTWLTTEENDFIRGAAAHPEASVVIINKSGITVVGYAEQGMLYGVQTICQLGIAAHREKRSTIPCLGIRDWPDLSWRCLAPTLTWYSGWNRLEGYDICNWSEGEWKWLADWSLLHKCNAWAVCMYGYWPFALPGYSQETLDVDSFFYNPVTKQKEPHRFVHPNIRREFFSRVIQYANECGIKVHAYIGKNSFNGCRFRDNPAIYAGGAAEMLPFAPGVDEYWDAFTSRILEIGFNGFVFEDPEANHVPNQNQKCYETFWEPWAAKYGFSSVKQTDHNQPPLGVHVEYYSWLYRQFAEKIRHHSKRLGRSSEIFLISHVLLARIMAESKNLKECRQWINLIDQKHGERVRFIITESNEQAYVDLLGGDRVASLGGRGGSCTCAMRRIASVNNNWATGPMGADLAYERDCQRRIVKAGGFGAMGYIFEWTNSEVFGYLAAQFLWNHSGIPGVSDTDQTGILYHSQQLYYGDKAGDLAAQAMDEGSDINDAMVLEGIYGSQYPSTGKALHRDYQFLAALADHAERLASQAYQSFTGQRPDLFNPVYVGDDFKWNGYDPQQDQLFKAERLRKLWLSTRRSQEMCGAALAHRRAQKLIAEGADAKEILKNLNEAVDYATRNQLIYQVNYDDDYDWTDGLCSKVTDHLKNLRDQFPAEVPASEIARPLPANVRQKAEPPILHIPWTKLDDILPTSQAFRAANLFFHTRIGFVAREDYFRVGVVYTVEFFDQDSGWRPIFRRGLLRRASQWEEWKIPVPVIRKQKNLRVRFVTDSYSRAQDRNAPGWKWALWGDPRLLAGHTRNARVIYDFGERLDSVRAFVRLDNNGMDRPFDKNGQDSTGATFKSPELDPVGGALEQFRREHPKWQWQEGFAEWAGAAPSKCDYLSYLGAVPSSWTYGEGEVGWLTSAPQKRDETAFVFLGSSDFVASEAELQAAGKSAIRFGTGIGANQRWRSGEIELFYFHGATIPGHGISGIYCLHLPARDVAAGKPVNISVRMVKKGGWIMCHGRSDVIQTVLRPLPLPGPATRVITAFTPHRDGQFGVTIGEFEVPREFL